jgi:hypothetical protein
MFDLDDLHRWGRWSHVIAGFIGLVLFWIPVFAKKGGRLHIRAGRAFVWCAYWVSITGLVASIWALCDPVSFIGTPNGRTISERAMPYYVEQIRFLYSILGFLSLGVLAGVVLGVRVIRTRRNHEQLRSPLVLTTESAMGIWSLGLALFGIWSVVNCYAGRHLLSPEAGNRYWLNVFLGAFGVYGCWSEFRYILRPRESAMDWWYLHMECMLGAGIGFHTAFLVFGANRFLNFGLTGVWQLLPWLLPSAIGLPATAYWVRFYRRRFEKAEPGRQEIATATETV